jgi:hypothetical protein
LNSAASQPRPGTSPRLTYPREWMLDRAAPPPHALARRPRHLPTDGAHQRPALHPSSCCSGDCRAHPCEAAHRPADPEDAKVPHRHPACRPHRRRHRHTTCPSHGRR